MSVSISIPSIFTLSGLVYVPKIFCSTPTCVSLMSKLIVNHSQKLLKLIVTSELMLLSLMVMMPVSSSTLCSKVASPSMLTGFTSESLVNCGATMILTLPYSSTLESKVSASVFPPKVIVWSFSWILLLNWSCVHSVMSVLVTYAEPLSTVILMVLI